MAPTTWRTDPPRPGGATASQAPDLLNMAAARPLPAAARLCRQPARPASRAVARPAPPCLCARRAREGRRAPLRTSARRSAMGRAGRRLPALAALFYGALAALALLGVRDVLFLYEENRCSMTYMYEYPEYLVSAAAGGAEGACGGVTGGNPPVPERRRCVGCGGPAPASRRLAAVGASPPASPRLGATCLRRSPPVAALLFPATGKGKRPRTRSAAGEQATPDCSRNFWVS